MQWLILFTLCFTTFNANSKTQEHPLKQLLHIEIAAYQLSSAFSAYVLFTGSPKFSQKLERVIDLTGPILSNASTRYPEISKQGKVSLDFIENNKALVFDDADHRLVVSLASVQNLLYQMIDDKKQFISQNSLNTPLLLPEIEEYLNTRASFERVLAQYSANAASSSGFAHSDITIEDNVSAFTASIKNNTYNYANFRRLNLKWNFVKNNMLKNPGQTSPFITLHTATDIRQMLQDMYKSEWVTSSHF
jgi:hypothetical protein